MIVGALVLPPISAGITDASTTDSASSPRTRSVGIDDGHLVVAHAAGADRVIDRVGAPAHARDQLVVATRRSAIQFVAAVSGRAARRP